MTYAWASAVRPIMKASTGTLSAKDIDQVVATVAERFPHVSIDEIVVWPVAKRAQCALFRGSLGWREASPVAYSPVNEKVR
jgi:hypothetical protein